MNRTNCDRDDTQQGFKQSTPRGQVQLRMLPLMSSKEITLAIFGSMGVEEGYPIDVHGATWLNRHTVYLSLTELPIAVQLRAVLHPASCGRELPPATVWVQARLMPSPPNTRESTMRCRAIAYALEQVGARVKVFFVGVHDDDSTTLLVGGRIENRPTLCSSNMSLWYGAALGDQLCLTPVLRMLRRRRPGMRIAISSRYPELYIGNSDISEIVWQPTGVNGGAQKVIETPSGRQYRNLTLQDSHADQLGLPRGCANTTPIIAITEMEQNLWAAMWQKPESILVGFAPYSRWPSKEWPAIRWQKVLDYLKKEYQAEILVLGTGDREYRGIGVNLLGRTDLRTLALILRECSIVLSVDNGVTHMAAGLHIPTVALYGPLRAELRAYVEEVVAVQATSGCFGCYHTLAWTTPPKRCPLEYHECMQNISVCKVIASIRQTLDHVQQETVKQTEPSNLN